LSPDGRTVDPGLRPGIGALRSVAALAQPDGNVLLTGAFLLPGENQERWIVRLRQDGSFDRSFEVPFSKEEVAPLTGLQNNGNLVVARRYNPPSDDPRSQIVRLNYDGSISSSFELPQAEILRMIVQQDEKVIVAFYPDYRYPSALSRFNKDGTPDQTFESSIKNPVNLLFMGMNGKVLVVERFTAFDGIEHNRLVRLNVDGKTDAGFIPVLTDSWGIRSLALQPDGKVIIAGWFTNVNDVSLIGIARITVDGSLDATFNPVSDYGPLNEIAVQKDGKVVCLGYSRDAKGRSQGRVFRLNTNGNLDKTFDQGTGPNGLVWSVALEADGKLIVGGDFTLFNGAARGHVVRLWGDPTLQSQRIGGELSLSWPNGVIQSAGAATGPYLDVPEASNPYKTGITEGQRYFRLRADP
jgi:uncharacterized delta-60 repeat protein